MPKPLGTSLLSTTRHRLMIATLTVRLLQSLQSLQSDIANLAHWGVSYKVVNNSECREFDFVRRYILVNN